MAPKPMLQQGILILAPLMLFTMHNIWNQMTHVACQTLNLQVKHTEELIKRPELKITLNRQQQVDSAVEDLMEAVGLNEGENINSKVLCLLGKFYEWEGIKEEAKEAFQKVLNDEPDLVEACNWWEQLGA